MAYLPLLLHIKLGENVLASKYETSSLKAGFSII